MPSLLHSPLWLGYRGKRAPFGTQLSIRVGTPRNARRAEESVLRSPNRTGFVNFSVHLSTFAQMSALYSVGGDHV
jgi:hypothetical protein